MKGKDEREEGKEAWEIRKLFYLLNINFIITKNRLIILRVS